MPDAYEMYTQRYATAVRTRTGQLQGLEKTVTSRKGGGKCCKVAETVLSFLIKGTAVDQP